MSASFRSILQQVTQEKLEELKLQKNLMTSHFAPILEKDASSPSPLKERLHLLHQALASSPVQESIDPILIENLKYVLSHAQQDPSLSDQLLGCWIERVTGEINYALRKTQYSYLYGSLLSEWLEVEEKRLKKTLPSEESSPMELELGAELSPNVAKNEKKEAVVATLKKAMFTQDSEPFDGEKFKDFLSQELFSFGEDNIEGQQVLAGVVKESGDFFKIEDFFISSHDVRCCIRGLASGKLLSQEKKIALKELSDNDEALEEVATLLSTRLKNLNRWEWPSSISEEPLELRRSLSGEYKAYLNEDIITALFLQYVGVEWAAYFKGQFKRLYDSRAWNKRDCKPNSIEAYRKEFHKLAFLAELPDSVEVQENKNNKDEYAKVEAVEQQVMSLRSSEQMFCDTQAQPMSFGAAAPPQAMRKMRSIARPPPQQPPRPPTDVDFKQQFLHVLSTEIKLNAVLSPHEPLNVVQAELESFGPSVAHQAVLVALEFLGVGSQWLNFFKKFLQPKVKFEGGEAAQQVVRGLPNAHVLSSFFGETLLFLLDFLVNRKCDGLRIYRISEELWFWSPSTLHITKAWETLLAYGAMVGLKVNPSRSGSVSVFSSPKQHKSPIVCGPEPLPQRSIHWGYLLLHSNGLFIIDEGAVGAFLQEMKGLLASSSCVLEWINIFNKYFTFFIRNFGKCAVSSGKQHLDQIVAALNQIYDGLLDDKNHQAKDPVALLKGRFFQSQEILDGFIYWPLEKGGLGLVNPFIGVMALRETFAEAEKGEEASGEKDFSKLPYQDKLLYEELKKEHARIYGDANKKQVEMMGPRRIQAPNVNPKLPSWDEYIGTRETELGHWQERYLHLLERPGPKYPPVSGDFHTLGWRSEDGELERNYFMWLFTYYEGQLKDHFGSVTFINAKLLPMSMIANIQKSKVRHN